MPPRRSGSSGCLIAAIVLGVAFMALIAVVIVGAVLIDRHDKRQQEKDDAAQEAYASSMAAQASQQAKYNQDATGEVVGQRCRVVGPGPRFGYTLTIQNSSDEDAYKYSIEVTFSMSNDQWGDPFWSDIKYLTVTVGAGKGRKVFVDDTANPDDRQYYYGCQVTSARKSPASP